MAQQPQNRHSAPDIDQAIPTASVDINPGDVVISSRKHDPRSLALVNATAGRIRPLAVAFHGQWLAGVVDGKFTSAVVGATLYATPDATSKLRIFRDGVHRLAISNTSGKKGDYVVYASGASGAQVFSINNKRAGIAIGRIAQDFSGASADDTQQVELLTHAQQGQSIYYWLENRVVDGCEVLLHAAPGSQIKVGYNVGTIVAKNLVMIQNQLKSIAQDVTLAFGGVGSVAASTVRFKWVVARSGSFAIRSGSGTKAALASYTVAGVTIGLLTPVTMTAGEIPIALLIQFSAATQSAARIKNVRGLNMVPNVGSWGI